MADCCVGDKDGFDGVRLTAIAETEREHHYNKNDEELVVMPTYVLPSIDHRS